MADCNDSQIAKVKRKFTAPRKKRGERKEPAKYEWIGMDAKQNEHVLTEKWMTDNFVRKFNEKPWYDSLLKKSARNKWMAVPAGAIRQETKSLQGKHKLTESESRSTRKKRPKSIPSFLSDDAAPTV